MAGLGVSTTTHFVIPTFGHQEPPPIILPAPVPLAQRRNFTSPLWEQLKCKIFQMVYFGTKESLSLKGGIDLTNHH